MDMEMDIDMDQSYSSTEDESEDESQEHNNQEAVWETCQHNGPVFCPEYTPLPDRVKFYYNGNELKLSIDAEEAACFYAKKRSNDITVKFNFFKDWIKKMTPEERKIILELDKCDFQQMHSHLNTEKYLSKDKNNELSKKNGIAEIDGKEENLKNYKIREHGLFEGKGSHPNNGMITNRIRPKDVTINCSRDSVFPVAPTGTKWLEIVHQNNKQWLASWRDNVQDKIIYMSFHPSSSIKINEDEKKYEKAKGLSKEIDNIRKEYHRDMESEDIEIRQRAVAVYFIDEFLIRGGNEKHEDEAETYGCCSLLIKHIKLLGNNFIEFDFSGKHSIRYNKLHKVIPIVYNNLESFINGKSDGDNLFGKLTCKDLNTYLDNKMNGLTTKVFRTCNASTRYEKYLEEFMEQMKDKDQAYKMALEKVANDCNHTTGNTTKNNYLDPRITFAWSYNPDIPRKKTNEAFGRNEETYENFKFKIEII